MEPMLKAAVDVLYSPSGIDVGPPDERRTRSSEKGSYDKALEAYSDLKSHLQGITPISDGEKEATLADISLLDRMKDHLNALKEATDRRLQEESEKLKLALKNTSDENKRSKCGYT